MWDTSTKDAQAQHMESQLNACCRVRACCCVQAKLAELEAAKADPWLNEDPQQAASAMSPARVRKQHGSSTHC